MLARTLLQGVPHQHCCLGTSSRAAAVPPQQVRALVVARTSYSARSSSPRSESWRSSWRTELDHGSNGNGNGNGHHVSEDTEYVTAYDSNGNGYYGDYGHGDIAWQSDGSAIEETQASYDAFPQQQHDWQDEQPAGSYSWQAGDVPTDAAAEGEEAGEEEEGAGSSGGFFSDAFKDALKSALQRSPLYAHEYAGASGDEESVEPQPYEDEVERTNQPIFTDQFRSVLKESLARQQAELDKAGYGSDDEYIATPYVPAPPPRREMSPIEEVIATALGASQLHLRRLNLVKNEIEAAIERETKQIERLDFALHKAQSDIAYYKSLEAMMQQQKGK